MFDKADQSATLRETTSIVSELVKDSKRIARVDSTGDLDVKSGYRQQLGPFYTINMAANTNASLRLDSNSALSSYIPMFTGGSVLEIGIFLDAALTAGTSDLDIRLLRCPFGDTPASTDTVVAEVSLSDSSPTFKRVSYEKDTLKLDEGYIYALRAFTDASWTSTTTDIWAWIKVEI
jgi:hypothetical protein